MLVVLSLATGLFVGLAAWTPRAAGSGSGHPLGDPGSGWIPDVPVEFDAAQSERNAAITTAANGDLYMAFETGVSGSRGIYFTSSSDQGQTWGVPVVVADGPSNEVTPSISQDPFSGRVFVAYALGNSGATPIHDAYSDDLVTWTDRTVLPCGVLCVRPRVVSEYWNGTNNVVYVALSGTLSANDWNMAVARSLDHGDTWTWYESGLGPADVRYQPDIAVQKGFDGADRVFVFYRGGPVFPGTTGYLEWSQNHGQTWAPRASWLTNVTAAPSIAAAHDGTSLLLAYNTNPPQVAWVHIPDPKDLSLPQGTMDVLPMNGTQPALTADGIGSTIPAIGGSYSLIAHDPTGAIFEVAAPVTMTSNADWSAPQIITDSAAVPSSAWPEMTITTQSRNGTWFPAAAWTDDRAGNDDIYYSTSNAFTGVGPINVTIDTVPSGQRVTLDGATRFAPATYSVSAGFHTISTPSPQPGAPGWRYAFASWSDGGAISHVINVTANVSYVATFGTQVLLTINSAPGGVSGAGWYNLNAVATIQATSPQPGAPGTQYLFSSWSGDVVSGALSVTVTMDAPKTVNANWQTQYMLTLNSARGAVTGAGWYNDGTVATMTVQTPQAGGTGTRYRFTTWSGDVNSVLTTATVTMNSPKVVTANWATQFLLTLNSAHGGVSGAGWYDQGMRVTIFATTPQSGGAGTRYDFSGWTGDNTSPAPSIIVTMDAPRTLLANWQTMYLLTVNTTYGRATGAGWYAAGSTATVALNATEIPSGGATWQFAGWSGGGSGTSGTTTVIMDGPKTMVAMWQVKPFSGPVGTLFLGLLLPIILLVAILLVVLFWMRRKKKGSQYLPMQPGQPMAAPPTMQQAPPMNPQPWTPETPPPAPAEPPAGPPS